MSKKRRRSGPAIQIPTSATPEVVADEIELPEYDFRFIPDFEPVDVDERDLHDLVNDWRHGRATRSIWDALQDAYFTLFVVALVGSMLTSVIVNAQSDASTCDAAGCLAARTLLPVTLIFALAAATCTVSRLFGPVLASAAEGFWLMDSPVSRTGLLGKRLRSAVLAGSITSALIVGLVSLFSGSSYVAVALWALAAGLISAALVAFAAAEQAVERTSLVAAARGFFAVLAALAAFGLVAVSAGWVSLGAGNTLLTVIAGSLVALGAAGFVAGYLVARRRLRLIRRARLISGGSLVSGMQGAMYALDFGLMRDILVEREAYRRGRVEPTSGQGLGLRALIWRDFQRVRRFPKPLGGLFASALVPYALAAMDMHALSPLLSGLALVVALVPFLQSLRVLTRTHGLLRMIPFKNTEIRQAAMVVPGVFSALWMLVTLPAFVLMIDTAADPFKPVSVAILTGFAGLMGAVRWVSAKKVDFNAPMVATESGAMPPTLMLNLFKGIDMVALITGPLLFGLNPLWSTAIAALVFLGMRGSFNMDEMKAQEAAAKREMAQAKAEKEKRVISRPKR